jgi:hypothetical protein
MSEPPFELKYPPRKPKNRFSPTERTLKALREKGYTCFIVEHWNSFIKCRQDLFGFVDILALGTDEVIGIQACARGDVSKRVDKIANHKNVGPVRKAGIRIEVHGWERMASGEYECRVVDCS